MLTNTPAIVPDEGATRERLAAYFLSVPPYAAQTPVQQAEYRAHLRELGALENDSILRNVGVERVLTWGEPVPLLQNLLAAAQQLAATVGQPLMVFPAKGISIRFVAPMNPRLLSTATVNLLRIACMAAPRRPVWVRLQEQASGLVVSITAEEPFYETQAVTLARESARLHGGSLALCDNRMAFSFARAPAPPPDTPLYPAPSAAELLRDTLSPVWSGFYAWLDEASPSADGSSMAEQTSSPHTKQSANSPIPKSANPDTPPAR